MNPTRRVLLLIVIMTTLCLMVEFVAVRMLYGTALAEERGRLTETVQSQARLIEAIARFDSIYSSDYPGGSRKATLSQIVDAHNHYQGFGNTGEFTLSQLENNMMVFLLSHRHADRENPKPIPLDSKLAEPMRQALSGKSGTIIGLDYRGEKVLAAYEPVKELDLGIVAKIDIAEIRAPFKKTAILSGLVGLVAIMTATVLVLKVTDPLLAQLKETIQNLQSALGAVKQLRGMLPICASCKKIRDDKGYWNQIESYIQTHSEAEFSHSLCPDCCVKFYPDIASSVENEVNGKTADALDG